MPALRYEIPQEARYRLLSRAGTRAASGGGPASHLDPEVAYGPPSPMYRPQPKHLEVERHLREGRRRNLLVGGSRSGKTFIFVKHVVRRALLAPGSRHAILRARANAAHRTIRLDTLPKVLRLCYPRLRIKYHDQDGYASTPDGSEIWIGGLDDKERTEKILGAEFVTLLMNECSQISYGTVQVARTRLAQVCYTGTGQQLAQQELMDLNPVGKSHYSHREFVQRVEPESRRPIRDWERDHYMAFVQPQDNAANLDAAYLESLDRAPSRYRKRFYEGQYADEIEGALWTLEAVDHARIDPEEVPETLDRVVVAVDPSGTSGDEETRSDDVGIIVAGRSGTGLDSRAYVLEDATCNEAPITWGTRAVALAIKHRADRIVAEGNFGGAMVKAVIESAARAMGIEMPPVVIVTASRGKAVRAEPISVLYGHLYNGEWTGDRVRHAGEFVELEEEMLNFSTFGYLGERSPNRADALVWALTDLMIGEQVPSLWGQDSMRLVS